MAGIEWLKDWDQAMDLARDQGKRVYVDFFMDT